MNTRFRVDSWIDTFRQNNTGRGVASYRVIQVGVKARVSVRVVVRDGDLAS